MKVLKLILLLSAAVTVILRLFSYNNTDFLDENTVTLLNIISIAAAAVCLICAIILIIILKKEEKRSNDKWEKD